MEAAFLQAVCRQVAVHAAELARQRGLVGPDDVPYGLDADPEAAAAFDPADALAGCRACARIYDQIAVWVQRPAYRREIRSAVAVLQAVFWGYAHRAAAQRDAAVAAAVTELAARFS